MSDVTEGWYRDWKRRIECSKELYNKSPEEWIKHITGYNQKHAAWCYGRIHGAVLKMGGFANFKHYVNECAESDYEVFENQEDEIEKLKRELNIALQFISGISQKASCDGEYSAECSPCNADTILTRSKYWPIEIFPKEDL